MNYTLYELSKKFSEAIALFELSENDNDEALETIQDIDLLRDEKLGNCCGYIKNLEGEIDKIEAEIERLNKKKKVIENREDRFKTYMTRCIPIGDKFSNGVHKINWKSTQAIEILDESKIPEQYLIIRTTSLPDKKAMTLDIKNKIEIPGVQLITRHNIQIG